MRYAFQTVGDNGRGAMVKEYSSMQNIDWSSLGFRYMKTRSHIRYTWRDGAWDKGSLVTDDTFQISIAASALHYGQAAFEGLKVFRCKVG